MIKDFDLRDVVSRYVELVEEIDLYYGLLSEDKEENKVSKEGLVVAGIFAKLDMILETILDVNKRLEKVESKLNQDNSRVKTWLDTTINK